MPQGKANNIVRKVVRNKPITIGDVTVNPGERKTIDLKVGKLYTHSELTMPVQVWCGKQAGPVLFISAAIHGDELNGVEIIRRLLKVKSLQRLKGTLITVPIVNLHGFINHSRYLPDRRDLNRSFPGSKSGSIAGRLANIFLNEIVKKATHGIDLHTGAINRTNLPQIRADLDNEIVRSMAESFGSPVMLNSNLRDGSLRAAAVKQGIPILLYEAGEALRFDEVSIRAGVQGIINVMRHLEMLQKSRKKTDKIIKPVVARASFWIRAPQSGIFRSLVSDGYRVEANKTLIGVVSDPFGEVEVEVYSPNSGIVIGQMCMPLVNEGEALFHIAKFARSDIAEGKVGEFQEEMQDDSNLMYPNDDIPSI
ncbi:succinylglutamate desuccinylase [Thiomicrorhabdus immobilis]|uniref:Succinylglutamate desuccinylase n=1 Tax=Thiomicrorhabdus immobilis TaxID=2791037 RepID=A0ABM7MBA1_9GAMM|nr:succinylglutamate desuccinylase/aspartoacylase family protein [Thiomicrorhabdus immobilis]BCN92607.1 succinylglutamate desuccinylase [Thiomicrorhabdus immobilis]